MQTLIEILSNMLWTTFSQFTCAAQLISNLIESRNKRFLPSWFSWRVSKDCKESGLKVVTFCNLLSGMSGVDYDTVYVMPRTVKCLDVLPYLQASKFADRHFMDAERRHRPLC